MKVIEASNNKDEKEGKKLETKIKKDVKQLNISSFNCRSYFKRKDEISQYIKEENIDILE